MNPYFKTTKGYNAEVVVAKAVAYTTDADYKTFVDNSVEGEVGVFNADTLALLPASAAAAAGTNVFIAQKRDAVVHKTIPFAVKAKNGLLTPYQAPAKNKWTVTVPAVVGKDVLEVAIVELTAGSQPYHVWNFDVEVKAGEAVADAVARLAARINDARNPVNYAFGQIVTASSAAAVLTLEAVNTSRFFKVLLRQKLEDAVLAETVKAKFGSGTYEGIAQIEAEGHIFDGVTTNYVDQNILPSEMGEATKFAVPGVNYDVILLTPELEEASPLPFHKHTHKHYIFVASPTTGTAPTVALKVILGFQDPA